MCRAIRLLTLLACFLVASSNPIEPADEIFFLNLNPSGKCYNEFLSFDWSLIAAYSIRPNAWVTSKLTERTLLRPITEQSALMEMIVDAAGRAAAQRSAGSSMMTEIDMKIPEIVIQRMRDPNFDRQMLARWIGRRWNLPDSAVADIVATGRGCSPRICLSISSRSSMEDTCCPFG
jgi:hypothetical protein